MENSTIYLLHVFYGMNTLHIVINHLKGNKGNVTELKSYCIDRQ